MSNLHCAGRVEPFGPICLSCECRQSLSGRVCADSGEHATASGAIAMRRYAAVHGRDCHHHVQSNRARPPCRSAQRWRKSSNAASVLPWTTMKPSRGDRVRLDDVYEAHELTRGDRRARKGGELSPTTRARRRRHPCQRPGSHSGISGALPDAKILVIVDDIERIGQEVRRCRRARLRAKPWRIELLRDKVDAPLERQEGCHNPAGR